MEKEASEMAYNFNNPLNLGGTMDEQSRIAIRVIENAIASIASKQAAICSILIKALEKDQRS